MARKYRHILISHLIALFAIKKLGVKRRALSPGNRQLSSTLLTFIALSAMSCFCFSKTMIYVANTDSQHIMAFQLNEKSGKASLMQKQEVGGAVMPMRLSHVPHSANRYSPPHNLLYAAVRSEPYRLIVLAINPVDGTLTIKSSVPLIDNMANIALDRAGRYLFAASYSGNKISAYKLDAKGMPGPEAQVLMTGTHPHQITSDGRNQFAYVSLLGEDRLDYYRFRHNGKSSIVLESQHKPAITLPAGSGPRHFVFSKKQNFIYLLNELNASVQVLQRDLKTGELALLETHLLLTSNVKPWAADIHITPDGKFLYATERTSHRIFGFAVDSKTGKLNPIGNWETEAQPRAFAISPQGNYLAVVGQKSNQMSIYRIVPANGRLELVDRIETGRNPSWVEITVLPASE